MTYVAKRLGEYISSLSYGDIPQDAIQNAKYRILDTIAVALAGYRTEWSQKMFEYAMELGGVPESTIMLFGGKTNAENAALVHGTMAHSLDYDDDLAGCHIGSVIIPAALAAAEKAGSPGKEVILSVIAGYDVTVAVSKLLNSQILYQKGFHPTSVCGVFGANATAGRLLGLDAEKMAMGISIAGSFPSGSMEYLADGAWTKRFQPGKAAKDGIAAALLARKGYVGPKSIFEGRDGVLKAYTGQLLNQSSLATLGKEFEVNNVITKFYPACSCNGAPIEAAMKIVAKHGVTPQEIESIDAKTTVVCIGLVGDPLEDKQNPSTVLEAQLSLPYCVARTILDQEFTLRQIQEEKIRDPVALALARRIRVSADAGFDISVHPRPQPVILTLKTKRGDVYTERVDFPAGNSRNPLSEDQWFSKLEDCAANLLGVERTRRIAETVLEMEKLRDISVLMDQLKL